tara:strand:+ start:3047 stop:3343 length:297 start_codon:yes stop_codon:yes gene_type:complete
MSQIVKRSHECLGIVLAETAKKIFRECGAEHDFCIQHISGDDEIYYVDHMGGDFPVQVFGGTNRLLWHPIQGWALSDSHCSHAFIEAFEALKVRGRFL